ncbi:unnamed protein product [Caenorhabditis angaria]|uniref:aralkylamine N-acetyltransferase n=1 Tax=Caenorhabditis angaria TaxID=860376 RepID=A0A9P1IZQ6_9PELO|nr:unnamed protein product [Caenorhabditis angaria]
MDQELIYRLAFQTDTENICQFLFRYFYYDEPLGQALKVSLEEVDQLYREIVNRCLKFPFSTLVTRNDGEIVGVLLISVWNRNDSEEDNDYEGSTSSEGIRALIKLLNEVHSNFWSLAPSNIDSVLHREVSSVAPHFQRKGIATRMLNENLNILKLKSFNIGGVISETCSYSNQVLLAKHGFKPLKEIKYSTVEDSKGNKILKPTDGSEGIILNYKSIDGFDLSF